MDNLPPNAAGALLLQAEPRRDRSGCRPAPDGAAAARGGGLGRQRRSHTHRGRVVHVKDGRLVAGGTWVGTHTSQLAANVVAPLFPAVTAADWQETSMINATIGLRHLVLEGDYLADVPLSLPSLFVLQLLAGSTITPAANLSLQNTTTFTGLVQMHGSCQLAISPPPMPPRPPGQLALRIPCGAPGQLALRIPCGAPAHGQLVPATRQYRSRE